MSEPQTTDGAAQGEGQGSAAGDDLVYRVGLEGFLAPVQSLLEDPTVSEIMIHGPNRVYVERAGLLERTDITFGSEHALLAAVNTIAQFCGKTISVKEPLLDGRLPDGSRVCVVLPPVSGDGISVNIRRFLRIAASPEFLLENKAVTPEALEFLELAVRAKRNILISGGTGSGKTTLLNILSSWFEPTQRVVVIEDTRELQLQQEHVIRLEARPADEYGEGEVTIRELFVTSLRMRPDRIVVGEVRRGEAIDMIQAMNSGHGGTMSTVHADSPSQACGRMEVMCLLTDLGLPLHALRRQIAMALHLVVQTARLHTGRRMITHISEVEYDAPENSYSFNHVFVLRPGADGLGLTWTGQRPKMAEEIDLYGLSDRVRLTESMWQAQAGKEP